MSPRPNDSEDRAQEAELLALLESGHPDAQERLYRAYRRRLLATAWHVLGFDDAEAEDAVQEAFLQASQALPRTKIHTSLYGWLNRVCVLRCIDIIRARRRSLAKEERDLDFLSRGQSLERQRRGAEDEEKALRVAALREAVQALGEPCRGLIWDRDVDGMSYIDLAKKHGLMLGTVMSRLSRCRESLKKKLLREERRDEG